MSARAAVLATLALTALAAAPAGAQCPDNPVCDPDLPNLWKRDTQFLQIWWNEARPGDVAECLEAGADPDANGILRHAAEWTRYPAVVQMLLDAGADPNRIGGVESPLFWAVQRTDNVTVIYGVVAALLYANADMGPDRFGYTPLYHILTNQPNSVALVELLLEAGSDPNGSWGAVSPLHHAAEHTTNPQVLEALLAVGADPNARIALDTTPLHIAIERCRQILVRPLLEHGADPNAKTGLDETPLEAAESCSYASERDNIVRMLREAGARESAVRRRADRHRGSAHRGALAWRVLLRSERPSLGLPSQGRRCGPKSPTIIPGPVATLLYPVANPMQHTAHSQTKASIVRLTT